MAYVSVHVDDGYIRVKQAAQIPALSDACQEQLQLLLPHGPKLVRSDVIRLALVRLLADVKAGAVDVETEVGRP